MAAIPWTIWARWLVISAADYAVQSVFDNITFERVAETAGAPEGRRVVFVFARSSSASAVEDPAEFGMSFVNVTGGDVDDSWTDADYTTMETKLIAYWNAIRDNCSRCALTELRWYREGPAIVAPNPSVRITEVGIASSGTVGIMAPQVACTTTIRTAVRRSWGRWYIPNIAFGIADGYGRISAASVADLGVAARDLFQSATDDEFMPAVYSRTHRGFISATAVEVDDVLDVIRRRRYKHPVARQIYAATA